MKQHLFVRSEEIILLNGKRRRMERKRILIFNYIGQDSMQSCTPYTWEAVDVDKR